MVSVVFAESAEARPCVVRLSPEEAQDLMRLLVSVRWGGESPVERLAENLSTELEELYGHVTGIYGKSLIGFDGEGKGFAL